MDIPFSWRELLRRIQGVRPEAFIGGGCLRDLDNNKTPKDIDIFVSGGMGEIQMALGNPVIISEFSPEYLGVAWADGAVGALVEYLIPDIVPPVNVIRVSGECSVQAQMERFDFGICQIATTANTVVTSHAYDTDKANRTFTLQRTTSSEGVARSMRRWERLSQRYEGWTLVVPPPGMCAAWDQYDLERPRDFVG